MKKTKIPLLQKVSSSSLLSFAFLIFSCYPQLHKTRKIPRDIKVTLIYKLLSSSFPVHSWVTPLRPLSDDNTLFVFCPISAPCLHSVVTQLPWKCEATVAQERIRAPLMVRGPLVRQKLKAKSSLYSLDPKGYSVSQRSQRRRDNYWAQTETNRKLSSSLGNRK